MILFHCKGPHIRNSRISTQFWPLTCVPPSPVLGDANRCKRAREMDQFGRWTLCRSVDLFCKAGTCNLWCLCSILIFRGCTVNSFILTFYFFSGTRKQCHECICRLLCTGVKRQLSYVSASSWLAAVSEAIAPKWISICLELSTSMFEYLRLLLISIS